MLILIALGATGLIITLMVLTRSAAPLPDYADPDVEDVSLDQFLDDSTD